LVANEQTYAESVVGVCPSADGDVQFVVAYKPDKLSDKPGGPAVFYQLHACKSCEP